jgi:hypothetical protein
MYMTSSFLKRSLVSRPYIISTQRNFIDVLQCTWLTMIYAYSIYIRHYINIFTEYIDACII